MGYLLPLRSYQDVVTSANAKMELYVRFVSIMQKGHCS